MPDRNWYAPAATAVADTTPAERFVSVAFRWNDSKSIARRVHIGGLDRDESQELLLVIAAIVPDVFDRAVDLEASTR
jgi:hypothetical protein